MRRSLSLLLLAALPSAALAQADSLTRDERPLCWRGKRPPACHQFWITEISAEYAVATTSTNYTFNGGSSTYRVTRPDITPQFLWTVGPMWNTSPNRALGVTVSAGFVSAGQRAAVEMRRRYWSGDRTGFDLTAGLVRMSVPDPQRYGQDANGLTAGAYAIGGDLIHVNGRADLLFNGNRVHAGGSVGVGLGSYPAVGATALLGVLVIVVIAAFAHNYD
jgi:hypothetical protein